MTTPPAVLGASLYIDSHRLTFHTKNNRVVAKLYQGESKKGSYYLDGLENKEWSYHELPDLFKTKVNTFLTFHNVKLDPLRFRLPVLEAPKKPLGPDGNFSSVAGPFEGSKPRMINSQLLITLLPDKRQENLSIIFNLVKTSYKVLMPSWTTSLFFQPIYHDAKYQGVVTGWEDDDFTFQPYLSGSQARSHTVVSVTDTFVATADASGTLYQWDVQKTNTLLAKLPKALDCYRQDVGTNPQGDERIVASKKLVCSSPVQIQGDIVAITKNGALEFWHLPSKKRLNTVNFNQAVNFGLLAPDPLTGFYYQNFTILDGTFLAAYAKGVLQFVNPFNLAFRSHIFEEGETYVNLFNGKVVSTFERNLYQRTPCSEEPRELLVSLGFETKDIWSDGKYLLLFSADDKLYLIDLAHKTKTELHNAPHISWYLIEQIRCFNNTLYIVESSSDRKNPTFQVYSFQL